MHAREEIKKVPIEILVPPSKSLTHRALFIAALSEPGSKIVNPLYAEDTCFTIAGLEKLCIEMEKGERELRITNIAQPVHDVDVFVGNSGTTARFLTAFSAFHSDQWVAIDGDERMRQRPLLPLLHLLQQMGAEVHSTNGFLPVRIRRKRQLQGGTFAMTGHLSSQFFSAAMMILARIAGQHHLSSQTPVVSRGYVHMTQQMLSRCGRLVQFDGEQHMLVCGDPAPFPPCLWEIEPDWSAAAFWIVAALLTGESVVLPGLQPDSVQPDRYIVPILQDAGNTVEWKASGLLVHGMAARGVECSLRDNPDLFPALAVYAVCAETASRFVEFAHLRLKESDRIAVVLDNLRRIGARVEQTEKEIRIYPLKALSSCQVRTASDHRIAMAFAILKLVYPELQIDDRQCVRKSYPNFWRHWNDFQRKQYAV